MIIRSTAIRSLGTRTGAGGAAGTAGERANERGLKSNDRKIVYRPITPGDSRICFQNRRVPVLSLRDPLAHCTAVTRDTPVYMVSRTISVLRTRAVYISLEMRYIYVSLSKGIRSLASVCLLDGKKEPKWAASFLPRHSLSNS